MMDSSFSKATGGGENFLAFIEKELMPHVEKHYSTAPYKVFVGHSFGGLTVLNALVNHTKLFNAYIAIDPSMWYDRLRFLAAVTKQLEKQKFNGTRLYVGIANTMPGGMTLTQLKKDTSIDTKHIRSIFALDKSAKANSQNGLAYASRYYNADDHGSVPLISEYDGLRFIFDFYRMAVTPKDFMDSSTAFVKKLKSHYETVSKKMGYNVAPPELFINAMGYNAMSEKHYSKAAALFQLNILNYPKSGNVYDSYADLLAEKKDTQGAISYYQKALAVKDNVFTRQKLALLEGKGNFTVSAHDLQQYAGLFVIDKVGVTITLLIKEDALWAEVPGEGAFQLVPFSPDTFTVKNRSGYEVRFEKEGEKVTGFTSVQPNGTFKAHLKK
jgi:hypothetical protein